MLWQNTEALSRGLLKSGEADAAIVKATQL
jgi:hypothetical protein